MKKTIITIILAFIVSASIAQTNGRFETIALPTLTNITFTLQSDNPTISWQKGSIKDGITPVDTIYEIFVDKPLRRISYKYNTKDNKPMELVKTDTYNGKDWDFFSISIYPLDKYPVTLTRTISISPRYNEPIYLTNPQQPARKQK